MFEHAQGGEYSERTEEISPRRYLDPFLQVGLVNYQERVVEGTVHESG